MSLHYDVVLAFDLKPSTPQGVVDAISYLVHAQDVPLASLPDHDFFRTEGWQHVLQRAPEDTRCPGDLYKSFRKAYRFSKHNIEHHHHTLSFRCYVLDDEFYHLFFPLLEWMALQSETKGFVGYYREELRWWPTLIYFKNDEVYFFDANDHPKPMRKAALPW